MNSKNQGLFNFFLIHLIYETATESFLKENFKDRVEEKVWLEQVSEYQYNQYNQAS